MDRDDTGSSADGRLRHFLLDWWWPYRATLLMWLACPSVICCHFISVGWFAYFYSAMHADVSPWLDFTHPQFRLACYCSFLLGAIGLPFGLAGWLLARRDLARMRKGLLDPDGEKPTRHARLAGLIGFAVCGFWVVFCGTVLLAVG
jgi:hypothetical protein